jgi:ribbon-helix-helix CopG family protein
MARMKRLQISIEPELDAALGREAQKEGVSKAALIRRWVAERVRPLPPLEEDPIWELVGIAGPGVEPEEIDEVVYGGKTRRP